MTRPLTPIALLLTSLATLPAHAQQGPPPPGPMHLRFVLEAVDLTAQQEAQVGPALRARHEAGEASRRAAERAGCALADQIRSATFDEAAIRAKSAAVAALEAGRAVADAALLRDVRAVLTADQRAKFDRLLALPPPPAGKDGEGR